MIVPGIKKDLLEKLTKEDAISVKNHLEKAKAVIVRKRDILDGKVEELGEKIKRPRDEIKQLQNLINKSKDFITADLEAQLLALEVDTRDLEGSIDKEYSLLESLEKEAEVQKKAEEELVLGKILVHQINLLTSITHLTTEVINNLEDVKGADLKDTIGSNLENLNNIACYFSTIIIRDELPELKVAYKMLELEGWPELEMKIAEIQTRFVRMEPKQP